MASNEDKDQILRERIESDLKVDGDSANDLINLLNILLKKNDKDALLNELKEIYEDSLEVDTFVDWLWNFYKADSKSPEKQHSKTQEKGETVAQKKAPGVVKLAVKAINDVKPMENKDNTTNAKRSRPAIYDEYERQQKLDNLRTEFNNSKKPPPKREQQQQQPPKREPQQQPQPPPKEEKRPTSILDRIIKPTDKKKRVTRRKAHKTTRPS
jgi:hypothetical protein